MFGRLKIGNISRFSRILYGVLMWITVLNYILIALSNPSGILNPGHVSNNARNFSVFYWNVQGLIPFGELKNKNPKLHNGKIHNLNLRIAKNKYDIIILNETWLKSSLSDNEIIPTDQYKVFRLDRSNFTHPPDPENEKKYRRNGGGTLIALRHDIDIESKLIPVKCKAEILSVELTDKMGKKQILTTFYRVGNLEIENHNRVSQYLYNLRRRRKVDEMLIIGDMNFPTVDWDTMTTNNRVEQLFLDTFNNLAVSQLINSTTHAKGNILDYILTAKPEIYMI